MDEKTEMAKNFLKDLLNDLDHSTVVHVQGEARFGIDFPHGFIGGEPKPNSDVNVNFTIRYKRAKKD